MGRVSTVCDVLGCVFGVVVDFAAEVSSSPGLEGCIVGTTLRAMELLVLVAWLGVAVMRW